jgi:hypothetical protein
LDERNHEWVAQFLIFVCYEIAILIPYSENGRLPRDRSRRKNHCRFVLCSEHPGHMMNKESENADDSIRLNFDHDSNSIENNDPRPEKNDE